MAKNIKMNENEKENIKQNLGIIIIDKSATLKSLTIKNYVEDELYKKCGFKKAEGFIKHHEWIVKLEGKKYLVAVYGKVDGKANTENKYDFPPPIDNILFFGSCAVVGMLITQDKPEYVSINIPLWQKIYEKLFGGFESLVETAAEDEEEEDELDNIPASKKTKQGYLKDGFVVDSDSSDENEYETEDDVDELSNDIDVDEAETNDADDAMEIEDIGSELSEEEYSDEDE